MYWLTGTLGLLLAFAPFLFGYASDTTAMWTSVILGGVTVFVSYLEGLAENKDRWEYITAAVVGLGIIAAPFVLGFGITSALWTSVSVGGVLTLLAVAKLYYDRQSFH